MMRGSMPMPTPAPAPKQRTRCWWCLPSQDLQGRDGWFKSPRDTTFTIDSRINGGNKPSGYDSNSLITILRSSQCFIALLVLILYVFTSSVPVFWLIFYTIAEVVLASFWSIFALFLRHHWSIWLVIPEIVITVAWIVLFAVSSLSTPDESKESTFRLSLMAIEASMVMWLPTCFLAISPFFHWLMPWLFQVRSGENVALDAGGAREMQIFPLGGLPGPRGPPGPGGPRGPAPGWPLPPEGLGGPAMDGPGAPGRALGMPRKTIPGHILPRREKDRHGKKPRPESTLTTYSDKLDI